MEPISLIFLSLFVIVSIILIIVMRKTLIKTEKYERAIADLQTHTVQLEEFIQTFSDNLSLINSKLKEIDSAGMFSEDDDVGYTFKTINLIMSQLQKFNWNTYAEEEKK